MSKKACCALILGMLVPSLLAGCGERSPLVTDRSRYCIGYTDMQCDDPRGQFYNWRTRRAMIVRADGSDRREFGASLIKDENTWTSFVRWWPDGRAVVAVAWESPENYAWEREHKTFRMTEGNWLVDCCLVDIHTGEMVNLTAVERVSNYNPGLAPWPGDHNRVTFAPIVNGLQRPYVMDIDGRNKKDLSSGPEGFTYGCSVSPDGHRIAYNKNYLVYIAEKDGSNPRRVDEDPNHTFQFIPTWSPDGRWLHFLSGQHYKCHPHVVRADGTGLRKLADRGSYISAYEPLKYPDFHSGGSDLPVWSGDSKWVYYTAQVGQAVELMRVSIDGEVQQLTRSRPGVAHFYPDVSPDSRLVVFGSTRDGAAALYVANADGGNVRSVTVPTPGRAHLHAHWAPVNR